MRKGRIFPLKCDVVIGCPVIDRWAMLILSPVIITQLAALNHLEKILKEGFISCVHM